MNLLFQCADGEIDTCGLDHALYGVAVELRERVDDYVGGAAELAPDAGDGDIFADVER